VIPELAVLLKAPRQGEVKTRLAREIGSVSAVRLYRRLAERTIAAARETGWPVSVWYAPADAGAEVAEWLGNAVTYRPQPDGDLGDRMRAAADGPRDTRVIVIGADCSRMSALLLDQAAAALDRSAVVLGPALDGGYYLVGGRRPLPELFIGMPWSTDRLLAETRRRLASASVTWEELEPLHDVDTAADARATGWLA
jgi:rSAM/selenodomain-associated transferase 1